MCTAVRCRHAPLLARSPRTGGRRAVTAATCAPAARGSLPRRQFLRASCHDHGARDGQVVAGHLSARVRALVQLQRQAPALVVPPRSYKQVHEPARCRHIDGAAPRVGCRQQQACTSGGGGGGGSSRTTWPRRREHALSAATRRGIKRVCARRVASQRGAAKTCTRRAAARTRKAAEARNGELRQEHMAELAEADLVLDAEPLHTLAAVEQVAVQYGRRAAAYA